jgi:hypothetical protein
MGKELSTVDKPGLKINRHLTGFVAGTSDIVKVEIIRNGVVIQEYEPDSGYSFEFAYDDMDPLEKISIKDKEKKPNFVFYYIRATQEDGHMAWSSPIWIDCIPVKLARPASKKPAKPAAKTALPIEEDFEDDEDDFDEE